MKHHSAAKTNILKANILLVETDARLRDEVSEALTLEGYLVFAAADGHEAFILSEAIAHPIHLIITDVILDAHLNGVDLARHLHVFRPGLKVLYLSGVPADESIRLDLQAELDTYVSKPFQSQTLLEKTARLLGRAGAGLIRPGINRFKHGIFSKP